MNFFATCLFFALIGASTTDAAELKSVKERLIESRMYGAQNIPAFESLSDSDVMLHDERQRDMITKHLNNHRRALEDNGVSQSHETHLRNQIDMFEQKLIQLEQESTEEKKQKFHEMLQVMFEMHAGLSELDFEATGI